MAQDLLEKIEDAALNAWPATHQMMYDGWLLRYTGGDSKRVNSVNVRYASRLPLADKIAYCETVYDRKGLPTIFRLPAMLTSTNLKEALTNAGYQPFDPTFVLGMKIEKGVDLTKGVDVRQLSLGDWLELRSHLSGTPLSKWHIFQKIIEQIVPEKVLLGLYFDQHPTACGMGVIEGDLLGYFSIYSAEKVRRRGYGRVIMSALTQWGWDRGASFGYLQVEGNNTPARALYEKLGFMHCYQYDYYQK